MEISRSRWLAFLAAAGSVVLAGAEPATRIRMGASPGDTFSEPYFATEYGAFDRAGLSVDISTFSSAGIMPQACGGDAIDVGLADVIQITNAINAGIPIAIFAAAAMYSSDAPTTVLVVSKAGPIQSAKDFEGKTIAISSLNSIPEISTREWLRQNGADPATMKFVEMRGSGMVESVLRGVVAGAVSGEPHLSIDKDRLRFFGKPYDVVAKAFPITFFFAKRNWMSANADATRRLAGAIYGTARWANDHHDETGRILEKNDKLEAAVVRRMTRTQFATNLDSQMLQPIITIATKYKAVKQPIAPKDLIASLA